MAEMGKKNRVSKKIFWSRDQNLNPQRQAVRKYVGVCSQTVAQQDNIWARASFTILLDLIQGKGELNCKFAHLDGL